MSYLLIGFWYQKPSANAAAIKPSSSTASAIRLPARHFLGLHADRSIDFETIFAGAPGLSGKTIDFFGWHATR